MTDFQTILTVPKILFVLKANSPILITHCYAAPELQALVKVGGSFLSDSLAMQQFGYK